MCSPVDFGLPCILRLRKPDFNLISMDTNEQDTIIPSWFINRLNIHLEFEFIYNWNEVLSSRAPQTTSPENHGCNHMSMIANPHYEWSHHTHLQVLKKKANTGLSFKGETCPGTRKVKKLGNQVETDRRGTKDDRDDKKITGKETTKKPLLIIYKEDKGQVLAYYTFYGPFTHFIGQELAFYSFYGPFTHYGLGTFFILILWAIYS